MGYDFFTRNGEARNEDLGGRVIGLSRDDLRRIGNTIAIAAEATKAVAILGALRTGAIDILATSIANCHAILEMAREDETVET
jgi:DNA-binding transcriptional regulator LsrR (DeoR family)